VNNLDTVAIANLSLLPIRAPHDFPIHLNGNSLWREQQLLDQFL
jgi:hypothetical protein